MQNVKHPYRITNTSVSYGDNSDGFHQLKNKIQIDVTYYFIMLMLGSICFGHHYAHRQELTTIGRLVLELLLDGSLSAGRMDQFNPYRTNVENRVSS